MIVKLSALPKAQADNYLKYYNEVMLTGLTGFKVFKPTETYDDFGLRFPAEYLAALGTNVIFFPLEIMAEYVDMVCKNDVDTDNQQAIWDNIINVDFDAAKMFDTLNATAIGNLAYVCLYSKNEKARNICEDWLNSIFKKAFGRGLDVLNDIYIK